VAAQRLQREIDHHAGDEGVEEAKKAAE